jgi:hypothetical protein
MTSPSHVHRSAPRTADELLGLMMSGQMPPRVSVKEPHWYATIAEDGCLLCGAGGKQQRYRLPGRAPKRFEDRYAVDHVDWACNGHFM